MKKSSNRRLERKLDLAARAAWLYYIAGNTQDEIAGKLNLSRQAVQRLVALAVAEKLIKFRLDHPISQCIRLAEALRARYGLEICEIAPEDSGNPELIDGVAVLAAEWLENHLNSRAPTVLALGSGRTLRATVGQVAPMDQPQHKLVSLVGNMARDGRAGHYDVVMRLADRIGAQCFLMPTPVVADTVEECRLLQTQHSFQAVEALAVQAKVVLVGLGEIAWGASLHRDGFINDAEVAELIELGAVGEILGRAFDWTGTWLAGGTNDRIAGITLEQPLRRPTVAVGAGVRKRRALQAALRGRLINGLITDEATARALLDDR